MEENNERRRESGVRATTAEAQSDYAYEKCGDYGCGWMDGCFISCHYYPYSTSDLFKSPDRQTDSSK